MEYLSVKEAAKKWNISERKIQQYCAAGKIEGAEKFSGAWAIPADAVKPADIDKEIKNNDMVISGRIPMPLMNTAFALGHGLDAVKSIDDPELRKLALAEYYYFSGQAEKAVEQAELFLTNPDIALRLSACWIYGYANLATGHIQQARYALAEVQHTLEVMDENTPVETKALAACIGVGASVLLHLPLPEGLSCTADTLRLLPMGLRYFALYVQAHYAYLQEDYSGCVGMVETVLALQTEIYPIPTIYLHLVATMAYMSLKQQEKAKKHLLAAWELARPDDLIEAFGEHHGLLGGMLEAVLRKDSPEDFKRIIEITYSFSAGWRKIHNPDTGHEVADNLTTTEFAIAMLAARGWTNQEIGEHLDITANTVKTHISKALQKLNIKHRKELQRYMLK